MSSTKRKRDVPVLFWVTTDEMEAIHQKMTQFGTKNLSAYLRKMAVDGYFENIPFCARENLSALAKFAF